IDTTVANIKNFETKTASLQANLSEISNQISKANTALTMYNSKIDNVANKVDAIDEWVTYARENSNNPILPEALKLEQGNNESLFVPGEKNEWIEQYITENPDLIENLNKNPQ
ncbi:hypothetical protein, partial [Labrenzia sp. 011]|uniref:hypothetical protein n=1 Tax=Labrenzia sp. 011 TaxID=2171494 RepID=UPI000D51494E